MSVDRPKPENKERVEIGGLAEFDWDYFKKIDVDDWIALDNDAYENQRYFTVKDEKGRNIAIAGVFDFEDQKNITHVIVDPDFRGQGLDARIQLQMADHLGLDIFHGTISPGDTAAIRGAEKIPGIRKVSTPEEEAEGGKLVYEWRREWMNED